MSNVFIPKKIRVGFQKRNDTFTGKLAYVIYYDEAGKIRKENSWLGWCDAKIKPIEMENKPVAGFVMNKGVQRDGDYFGNGDMVRMWHPDDFEFEITVTNLMGIMAHSDVLHREVVQPCILAWQGQELVLIPTNSEIYQKAIEYTAKQDNKMSARDLVAGRQYVQRKCDRPLTYVGYYEFFVEETKGYDRSGNVLASAYGYNVHRRVKNWVSRGKKHIFWDGYSFSSTGVNTLSHEISTEFVENFPTLVQKFFFQKCSGQPAVKES